MFKAMNQDQMMTVNGGFYYVPVYKAKYNMHGMLSGWTFIGTRQVASGSGIQAYYYF